MFRAISIFLFLSPVWAEDVLPQAYSELREKHYEQAIILFEQALAATPDAAAVHKDLAYTLLKVGENLAAREHFGIAMRLDPKDFSAALEYGFLCHETGESRVARLVFDRVRHEAGGQSRATAEEAFGNIDRPLAEGISRWQQAVVLDPANFSAHLELARLALTRDEAGLAAEQFEQAWRLRPKDRSLLVDLGRCWRQMGKTDKADSALLAASRSSDSRTAEVAGELLSRRYPYVYEFHNALELDPENIELRRELAYLHLEMGNAAEAEQEFAALVAKTPDDFLSVAQLGFLRLQRRDPSAKQLLDRVLESGDEQLADRVRSVLKIPRTLKRRPETPPAKVSSEARTLAEKSLQAGYLKDAVKYFRIAHEEDPVDFEVMLKLGWSYNMLHDDTEARRWFGMARESPDRKVAAEASQAYRNLGLSDWRIRTTVWMFPVFSTRWHDLFSYAQAKTEFRLRRLPLRPYVSVRFIGDTRQTEHPEQRGAMPAYLSESSFVFAAGVATSAWHGVSGWFEAGEAVKYLTSRKDVGTATPDYRGGLTFAKAWGHPFGQGARGWYAETNDDGVFVSRFQNDFLIYSQNRVGWTLRPAEWLGLQVYGNANVTFDTQRQYWANYAEVGPGVRLRLESRPKAPMLSFHLLRGVYLDNTGNPRRPNFLDFRIGLWYAFTY